MLIAQNNNNKQLVLTMINIIAMWIWTFECLYYMLNLQFSKLHSSQFTKKINISMSITVMARIGVYQYECLLITYSCVHIRKKCHKQKNEHKRALTSMPFNLKYNKSDRIRQRTWYQIGFYLDQYIYILYIKHTCNKKRKKKKNGIILLKSPLIHRILLS